MWGSLRLAPIKTLIQAYNAKFPDINSNISNIQLDILEAHISTIQKRKKKHLNFNDGLTHSANEKVKKQGEMPLTTLSPIPSSSNKVAMMSSRDVDSTTLQ